MMLVLGLAQENGRDQVVRAALSTDAEEQLRLINGLANIPNPELELLLTAWRQDELFLYQEPSGTKRVVTLGSETDAEGLRPAYAAETGQPLLAASGGVLRLLPADLTSVEHDSTLRAAMKNVVDLLALVSPDTGKRLAAIRVMGLAQDANKLAVLRNRLEQESATEVKVALRESIALIQLVDPDPAVQILALKELQNLHSLASYDMILTVAKGAESKGEKAVESAAKSALKAIDLHRNNVNTVGTLFRGLSLGSVLLIAALGLAITFGLMGIINMAHGEVMVVGAYTTYVVQNLFGAGLSLSPFGLAFSLPGLHATGWLYECYFLIALPLSFLMAALVGIALERGVIQFLYRRPLESLLATWGVSLVLQQLFRLIFGANNVQVYSPAWLSGNWTIHDVILGWNRVFVIGFAVVIVLMVWLILNRTSLGLFIRAVMQNRAMAACVGVRTERINMLTFGLGSGLAGLAGAFLSQIGNVGPSLGQSYIVDCFMTVVVGGVNSMIGTVISALSIGLLDQSLQQILMNPVLGKIVVLIGIILFLQLRPAGLFASRSRNLEN